MLPRPDTSYVRQQIARFDKEPRYYSAEKTIRLVFSQWPANVDYHAVLTKVIVLNRLYSTNIFDPYTVAQHIVEHQIDERLCAGDATLVCDLADVRFGEKKRFLLSFATKYCSWHQPNHYQIYDSYVAWLLWEYQGTFQFSDFKRGELREYPRFLDIVADLRKRFELTEFDRKQIDKFLWIEAVQQWNAITKLSPVKTSKVI